jgi:hypothetical protein
MLLLVILGLGILCALVAELSHSVVPPGTLFLITAAGAATILGSVFMVTRFWMHLLGGKPASDKTPRLGARPAHTNELGPSRPGALPDAHPASITEQTTRTLINK